MKGVFHIVGIEENAAANTENHRAMALDQRSKRLLGRIAGAGREPLEELPIGQLSGRADGQQTYQAAATLVGRVPPPQVNLPAPIA